jgi:hypothetical protein
VDDIKDVNEVEATANDDAGVTKGNVCVPKPTDSDDDRNCFVFTFCPFSDRNEFKLFDFLVS